MYAFNVVRFRVKPGHEEDFVEAHRRIEAEMPGLYRAALVRTGERSFCFVGEWDSMEHIADARPVMIGILDGFRNMLEELSPDLGVTDPVSGEVVHDVAPRIAAKAPIRKPPKRAASSKKKAPAARNKAAPAKRGRKKG